MRLIAPVTVLKAFCDWTHQFDSAGFPPAVSIG